MRPMIVETPMVCPPSVKPLSERHAAEGDWVRSRGQCADHGPAGPEQDEQREHLGRRGRRFGAQQTQPRSRPGEYGLERLVAVFGGDDVTRDQSGKQR